jgi:hypothetical protein
MKAVNLIPTDQRRGASVGAGQSGGAAYAVIAMIAAIAALAFLYGQSKHQVSNRKDEISGLSARATTLKGEVTALAPYTSFITMREAREKAVKSLIDSRFDWAHSLHEFARVVPNDISVASLDGSISSGSTEATAVAEPAPGAATSTASAAVTSATPPGAVPSFAVSGCGASQKAVAVFLQRLRLIDGVSEVTLLSSSKSGAQGGGSAGGSTTCPPDDPAYSLTITFQGLPTTEAASAAVKTDKRASNAADKSGSSSSTGGAQ